MNFIDSIASTTLTVWCRIDGAQQTGAVTIELFVLYIVVLYVFMYYFTGIIVKMFCENWFLLPIVTINKSILAIVITTHYRFDMSTGTMLNPLLLLVRLMAHYYVQKNLVLCHSYEY